MKNVIVALVAVTAVPAFAQDLKALTAADLAVQTHRWEGKLIETTLNCFYADKLDYRCYDNNSFARVRVDFQYFNPDGEEFLQKKCDRIEIANTNSCRVIITFAYENFDTMPVGGLAGEITLVRPENGTGYIIYHPGAVPSPKALRDARHFLARGSAYIQDPDDTEAGSKDCAEPELRNRSLDCPPPRDVNPVSSGGQEERANSPSPNKSCEAYETARQAIINQANHNFEEQKVALRIVDIRQTGSSSEGNVDYCNIEAKTNVGVLLKMKYHFGDNNRVDLTILDSVLDDFAGAAR